jgi:ribosomal protein S18 acetylase RimI-like enzyme|tara:strand:- start:2399 stop:2818 length:420 start_codon:yes stop_codon:yes gene_type:complete
MELALHPLETKHLSWLLEIRNHETTRFQLGNDSIFTLEEAEKWFETLESPWYIIMIGLVSVGYFRTDGDVIGCDIHPDFRRMGYARYAYKKYLEDTDYAELFVFQDNHAKKLYEELGFVETGEYETLRGRQYIKMIYDK